MRQSIARLGFLALACAWLWGSDAQARQNYNCTCEVDYSGWRFVLQNPLCGHDNVYRTSIQNNEFNCSSWCWSQKNFYAPQACSFECDNPPDPTPSQYSAEWCWNYLPTVSGNCEGPTYEYCD